MKQSEIKQNWEIVLELLSKTVDSLIIDNFFRPLKPYKLSEKDQKLYLTAPRENNYAFFQNMVSRYQPNLVDCINPT